MENLETPKKIETKFERLKNFLETHKNSIAMVFHRHAEHTNDKTQPDEFRRLAIETDIDKTIEAAGLIDFDLTVAYSVKSLRSFLTAYYLLKPNDSISLDQESQILQYEAIHSGPMKNKIRSKKELDYKDPTKFSFFEELTKAFNENKMLEFLVHHSDEYVAKGEDISAYTVVAKDIAKIAQTYIRFIPRWKNLSTSKFNNKNLFRTFCAREMVYGCFRAKITELVSGIEERDSFVKYYDKNLSQKDIGVIIIKDQENLVLFDGFGQLSFTSSILEKI